MDAPEPVIYLLGPSALDRQAYRLLLEQELKLTVHVDSGFSPVAVWTAMRARPDLALIVAERASPDIRDAVQMIPRLRKQTRLLVVSASVDEMVLRDWGRCDIAGYAVRDGGVGELQLAVKAILDGGTYYSPGVRAAIEEGRKGISGLAALSQREIELLPLLARGMKLRDAAHKMMVSYKTADSYRTSLLRKLGIRDRVELARYAIRERIIEP